MTYEDKLKHMRSVIASHAAQSLDLFEQMVKSHNPPPPPAPKPEKAEMVEKP